MVDAINKYVFKLIIKSERVYKHSNLQSRGVHGIQIQRVVVLRIVIYGVNTWVPSYSAEIFVSAVPIWLACGFATNCIRHQLETSVSGKLTWIFCALPYVCVCKWNVSSGIEAVSWRDSTLLRQNRKQRQIIISDIQTVLNALYNLSNVCYNVCSFNYLKYETAFWMDYTCSHPSCIGNKILVTSENLFVMYKYRLTISIFDSM